MIIELRQEKPADYATVEALVEAAFREEAFSDQTEHLLVARLRKSAAFIPELSIVVIHQNQVVGHILLSRILIKNDHQTFDSLALAPVSVLPDFQNQGIGGQLILKAHEQAKALGHQSIVLVGHDEYYPRFGYQRASSFGITLPFEVPDENAMVIALVENGLAGVSGMVEYSEAFFEL